MENDGFKVMTVADLKKILSNLPDTMEIRVPFDKEGVTGTYGVWKAEVCYIEPNEYADSYEIDFLHKHLDFTQEEVDKMEKHLVLRSD